ncbi:MAG: PD-(D/E)XK nuclease family protein, partial [Flavobacteriaceae bacterium]
YEEKLHGKAMLSDDLQDAIHYGILIHDLLSRISYAEELDHILEIAYQRGEITQNQKQRFTILFKKIVGHTTLEQYYNRPYKVLNEQTILLESKELVRPDRIVYQDDQVVVLDYKTGEINPKDKIQLSTYCQLIRDIFNRPTLGYLIYLPKNEDRAVETIEVSLNG